MRHVWKLLLVILAFPNLHFSTSAESQGRTYRDCSDCPWMVVIPSGSFMMGAEKWETDWAISQGAKPEWVFDEKPRHLVTIAQPFSMGKTEVTRGQYAAFLRATGNTIGKCDTHQDGGGDSDLSKDWRDPGFVQTDDHPAVCVSWDDAKAYVQWLTKRTGKDYRLPSEAEWEYAARASTDTLRYWGQDENNSAACAYANTADLTLKDRVGGNWASYSCRDGYENTSPVGTYRGNNFGLYDMLGNVWEWTEDCYQDSYNGVPSNGSASSKGDCSLRVTALSS